MQPLGMTSLDHFLDQFELPLRNPVLVFSLILFIILLAPIVLRKMNIPGIIVLIISGIIIGPHGFNFLAKNSATELFSTIGLLYIMFIAGLELDLNDFKAHRNKSLLFGLFTFILPLGIGYPICYYVLGYDVNASLLTASMFATHTLVAYPIVSRLGIAKNQAVAITVGGTILTDTAVLIMLAVTTGNHRGDLDNTFWITLVTSLAAFSVIMFVIVPRIAEWFFRKLPSEKHSHFIFVLSVVFFAAFLAEAAGVEAIIGAFVAGLALNKLIPHSSALMNRIEFIGNSLFIPFFLISVGMVVDLRVIFKGPMALIIAGTLTTVALTGKWVAAWVTQKSFRYTASQRRLIFGLSSSHAAATLAVILVGYNAGILDENILNGTIILILVTCIVASFVTERAGRQVLVESDTGDVGTDDQAALHNELILLPASDIGNLEGRLEMASFIKDRSSVNPITVVTVVSNDQESERNILIAKRKLEGLVNLAAASDLKVNVVTTIDHNPSSGIARISRELMADLVLIGWPSQAGLMSRLIGERLEMILESTDRTIFTCHFSRPLALHKRIFILVPPLAEFEKGFELWVRKLGLLAKELSISMVVHCDPTTAKAVMSVLQRTKIKVPVTFQDLRDWEDLLVLARLIEEQDLLVLVSARKGSVSYMSLFDLLPYKLEKHFAENSRLLVHPHQYEHTEIDFTPDTLNRGIETIHRLGKGIGNIFRGTAEP